VCASDRWHAQHYIEQLEINVKIKKSNKENCNCGTIRKSVVHSDSVKTGFVGFIICLKNVYNLAKYLIENNFIEYMLSYKLSQDHVEMFFSSIRRMNGHNNNPTTTQYISAYKKLLLNNLNIIISSSANCSPLDETLLISENETSETISDNTESDFRKKRKETSCKVKFTSTQVNDFLSSNVKYHIFEHNYDKSESYCSEYTEEIIKHIAGLIVRNLKRIIHCKNCYELLDGANSTYKSKLTILKDRGGLNFASDDVNLICKCTKKIIHQYKNLFVKNINTILITKTLEILPSSILNDNKHYLEQELFMDHRNQLILLIIQKYIDIRLKHESKISQDQRQRIRMHNNKLTIFSGQ